MLKPLSEQIGSIQDTQPPPRYCWLNSKTMIIVGAFPLMKSNSQAGPPWGQSSRPPKSFPNRLPDFCTPCQMHRRKRGRRKINKSSILMAHFRGTLPWSLRPDISKETTPQPWSSIKSSHPNTLWVPIRVGGMSNLIFQFGPPLQTVGPAGGGSGESTDPNRLNSWLVIYMLSLFVCLGKLTVREHRLSCFKQTKK